MNRKEYTSFDDLDLPEIIYKYRDWNNPKHKTIITNCELYFASPRDFEDEKDCMNLVDYSLLTDREIHNRYYKHSKKEHKNWSDKQHHEFAKTWFDKGLMREEERLKEIVDKYTNIFYDCFGVLSVTENYKSSKMWNKYSSSKTGFCVGISTRELLDIIPVLGGVGIDYVDELPKIHPDKDPLDSYLQQIHKKEIKWKFEQEFRLRKRWPNKIDKNSRIIHYKPESIKHIAFGANISEESKNEIKQIIKEKNINVKYTQIKERSRR